MGNCNHRRYIPMLVELTRAGTVDPSALITQVTDVRDAVDAYEQFDLRRPGWLKVALDPAAGMRNRPPLSAAAQAPSL